MSDATLRRARDFVSRSPAAHENCVRIPGASPKILNSRSAREGEIVNEYGPAVTIADGSVVAEGGPAIFFLRRV
jgi:hypothetical protein